jgi:CP family cyanate transporter-like MFS transporter
MFILTFVLLSLSLRPVFAGTGPLLPVLGLSNSAATWLSMLPILCVGLCAPLGAVARDRFGEEWSLFGAAGVMVLGLTLRSTGHFGLFAG